MKHHIIVKYNGLVADKEAFRREIEALYADADQIEGVHSVEIVPNVIDRPNRYDLMIALHMEKDALNAWDHSEIHKRWKEDYGKFIDKKTIFDSEA